MIGPKTTKIVALQVNVIDIAMKSSECSRNFVVELQEQPHMHSSAAWNDDLHDEVDDDLVPTKGNDIQRCIYVFRDNN